MDQEYRANQRQGQKTWAEDHRGYWKRYRDTHPEQAERNRILQRARNKRRLSHGVVKMNASMIAKMDASNSKETSKKLCVSGQFWLVPVIAKMDAIKVNLYQIPGSSL